ncbi:MAG: glycosyltransferase family 2 protein [Kiritimatiellae bacterium]|nr:glycosyltransferase family 2 protein [Kiritimatiellia bacterium]
MLSVVVPFLNEKDNLPVLYRRLSETLAGGEEDFEIIFVDDGSSDGSADWVAARAREDKRLKLIKLSRNFGHQIAITAGLDYSGGAAAVIIDADLQDPPEVIPRLVEKWRAGFEVVYAVREQRAGETWLKKLLAGLFYRIFRKLVDFEAPLNAGDFRLVDRKVVAALKNVRERHRFMRGLTGWVGYTHCAVTYKREPRQAGITKYPVWKSFILAWDALTSFSGKPLMWATGLGIFIALLGGLEAAIIIINKLRNPSGPVPGWATIMVAVLLLGGIQLISLGIIGQYVGRIFDEAKKRPLYFIAETIGLPPAEKNESARAAG